ncbi:MFS transporter [Neobacillus sp. D3-1R]|uniref:MFS transporter n=1 Tax=Neobacillus sp. D3-1R TaxID=3445778 RepID=UPI003F9F76D7
MQTIQLFRNKNFSYLFFAALIGVLGEGIFGLTSIVLVLKKTDSILEIGKMLVITLLPSIFLAPFIGVLIDKYDKYKIAIICNLLRFLSLVIIPLSYFLGFFTISIFFISIFFSYIFWYILEPTKESVLKELLPKELYSQGIAIVQGAWQIGLLSSAVLAGWIIDAYGVHESVLLASLTYLIGAVLFLAIKIPQKTTRGMENQSSRHQYLSDFKDGWRYLFKNKQAFYFVLTTSMTLPYFYAINALIAPYNYQILEGNGVSLGIIDSGAGIGSFISAVICTLLIKRKNLLGFLISSIVFLGLFTTLFSLVGQFSLAFIFYVLIGFFVGNVKVLSRSFVFNLVDQEYIGRIMGAISLLSLSFTIILSLLVSLIAEYSIGYSYLCVTIFLLIPLFLTGIGGRMTRTERISKRIRSIS